MIKFFLLLVVLSLYSCNSTNDVLKLIKLEYSQSVISDFKTSYILIVSDSDCMTCLDVISKQGEEKSIELIGFYQTSYPKIFIERLNKSYNYILWKPLKNKQIPDLLLKKYNKHGPYTFILKNNEILLIN